MTDDQLIDSLLGKADLADLMIRTMKEAYRQGKRDGVAQERENQRWHSESPGQTS